MSTDRVQENKWQKVELSWDNARGLRMFVDNETVATDSEFSSRLTGPPTDYHVYVGRPNDDISGGKYADVLVDELEFITAGVDYMKAYDIWNKSKSNTTDVTRNGDYLIVSGSSKRNICVLIFTR